MTALQQIIKEAQAIRRKSPKMEWKKAVAQASAIYSSKHKGKSPVGKKKVVKKAAKKVGAIKKYTNAQLEKLANDAAYATGGDLDKMTWRLLDNHKLIPVYKKAIKDFETKHKIKLSGVKKKAIKKTATKKAPVSTHKDTKSHNVKISVMSGVGKNFKKFIQYKKHIIDVTETASGKKMYCASTNKLAPGFCTDQLNIAKKFIDRQIAIDRIKKNNK